MEIRKLNMLRGIAALIVVIVHFFHGTEYDLGRGAGQPGVMFFFILSGFLMSYLYVNKAFSRVAVIDFIIARAARVLPLFVLLVVASYIFSTFGMKNNLPDIKGAHQLLSALLLLHAPGVLRIIPVEVHFYIFFVFLWCCYQYRPAYTFWGVTVLFVLLLLDRTWRVWKGTILGLDFEFTLIPHLEPFLIGVFLGWLYSRWTASVYWKKDIFIVSIFLLLLAFPKVSLFLFGYSFKAWIGCEVLLISSLVFFTLVFLVPDDNPFLANAFGDFLGKISYSLYLLHIPVLCLLKSKIRNNPAGSFAVFLGILFFVAYISYALVEAPARKAIRRFSSGSRGYKGS
jgi:peptidoglycan/LPS O-acetylase OafA/YrhL